MRNKTFLAACGLAIAVIGVAAIACGDEKSQEELTQQACSDLAAFDVALANLGTTLDNPSVTVGDAREARDEARAAYDDAVDSVAGVAEARFEEVRSAYGALADAIQGIPDDATLQQGVASLREDVAGVVSAERAFVAELDCP